MTSEQEVAYVISQSVCALIEAMGMTAENLDRSHREFAPAYTEQSFKDLIDKYGIYHNAVLASFQNR